MLTFEFTGTEGKMTQPDVLTSGMVGRKVSISLDESWTDLDKTVVFRAGGACKTAPLTSSTVVIPAEVLARPFCKLHVGICGTDKAGTLVTPTIMAEGPYIRYGADPTEDPTAEDLPVWKNLQNQIGDLSQLQTPEKDNLVAAINALAAGAAGTGTGLSRSAAVHLISILRHALFDCNQSGAIDVLAAELAVTEDSSGDKENGDDGYNGNLSGPDPKPEVYTVTNQLTNVTTSNNAATITEGSAYSAVLMADDGYVMESVTVTMSGIDITKTVYSGGTIAISKVTGNIVITAVAAETSEEVTYYIVANYLDHVVSSNPAVSVAANTSYSASFAPEDGYDLVSVSVTMGGKDITDLVFAHGAVTIDAVTGDILITAKAVVHTTYSETLDLVSSSSYPNVSTFEYSQIAETIQYVIATRGSIQGGLVSVNYDPEIYNNFALNFYVFDKDGNPYCQTDSDYSGTGALYRWGETDIPGWEGVGTASGFGYAAAPFTLQMPEGCTFIVCMRRNATAIASAGTGTAGTPSNGDFASWALSGGITITVTK